MQYKLGLIRWTFLSLCFTLTGTYYCTSHWKRFFNCLIFIHIFEQRFKPQVFKISFTEILDRCNFVPEYIVFFRKYQFCREIHYAKCIPVCSSWSPMSPRQSIGHSLLVTIPNCWSVVTVISFSDQAVSFRWN